MDPQLRIELQTPELCGRIITLHVIIIVLTASIKSATVTMHCGKE